MMLVPPLGVLSADKPLIEFCSATYMTLLDSVNEFKTAAPQFYALKYQGRHIGLTKLQ